MKKQRTYLTKSGFMRLVQCYKSFHFWWNNEEVEYSDAAQARMNEGIQIGLLAQQLVPGGIDMNELNLPPWELEKHTNNALKKGLPIYEATFIEPKMKLLCKVDILVPDEDGWQIWEVKSGNSVKEEHIPDVGFQLFTLRQNGIAVSKVCIVHLNREYVRQGELEIDQLFVVEDVTEAAESAYDDVTADYMREIDAFNLKNAMPSKAIGPHCSKPYDCPYMSICWKGFPEKDSIYTLPKFSQSNEYLTQGKWLLSDVDPDMLSDKQQLIWKAHQNRESIIDREGIQEFLEGAVYPQYFLDFETIMPALPVWDGTRPYQQIPFQYSLHKIEKPGGEVMHSMFLDDANGTDPRLEFLAQLVQEIGDSGTIWVYNKGFEKGRLKELAGDFPEYAEIVEGMVDRIMDLMTPFQSLLYYHPDMQGSASIKKVLPVLVPSLSYDELEIGEGGVAMDTFLRLVKGDEEAVKEKEKSLQALREYCTLDTLAMVRIWERLITII